MRQDHVVLSPVGPRVTQIYSAAAAGIQKLVPPRVENPDLSKASLEETRIKLCMLGLLPEIPPFQFLPFRFIQLHFPQVFEQSDVCPRIVNRTLTCGSVNMFSSDNDLG